MPQTVSRFREPGLTGVEAARRLAADGPNALAGSEPKHIGAIVVEVVTQPMFLLLLAAGSIYLALGDRAEAAFLLGFVFVVIGITIAQERRTHRSLEALRDLSAPRARVIRDGVEQMVPGRDVVRGDLVVLHAGDRVPADGRLVDGQVWLDESLLTGESVPVEKRAGAAGDAATVFGSTVATQGGGVAEVQATARQTAVGRIGEALRTAPEPDSPLQRASARLVRAMAVGAVLLSTVQVLLVWQWDGQPLLPSLLTGLALSMAILPEEIPVIVTVFLALGAWRMSRRQVLTRRIPAVETLGQITVLAVDKTGTLTCNRMSVAELSAAGGRFDGAGATGLPDEFHGLLEFAVLATPVDPVDPMEKAIQEFGRRWLAGTGHEHDGYLPRVEYPLSTEILAMTRVFPGGHPDSHVLACKGAPEAVIDLCHLPAAESAQVRARVDAMAERGLRVLGVARGRWEPAPSAPPAADALPPWPATQHDFDFEFLGLLGLQDPVRPEVPEAIGQCRRAGVRIIMMTGDHQATALAIARQAGLRDDPRILTGARIDALDEAALAAELRDADVCARLQPEHKLRLVMALQRDGEVVGMTGDGVNDAPALKAANVGIAMGQRGTDVAREAASLVLLDDSFARIVEALRLGRRIFDNICKATCFTFAVHVPIVALSFVPALLGWPPILFPVQIVLMELLIDPACSVAFEAEPEAAGLMERPPRRPGESPFSGANAWRGVLQGAGLAAALLGGLELLRLHGASVEQQRGALFVALLLTVVQLTFANVGPAGAASNPWRRWLALASLAFVAAALGIAPLRHVLGLAAPDGLTLAAAGLIVLGGFAWLAALRVLAPAASPAPAGPGPTAPRPPT